MNYQHKSLARGRWQNLTLAEQMANIGSEISRAILWKDKGQKKISKNAFYRGLELIFLTIDDPKNRTRLKEITRLHEFLVDYFLGENKYKSTDNLWNKYFMSFNLSVRNKN